MPHTVGSPSRRARWPWLLAFVAIAALAAYALRTPEPLRTAIALASAVCGPADERTALLERHLASKLELRVTDADGESSTHTYERAELALALAEWNAARPGCVFTLEEQHLGSESAGARWVEGTITYSDSQPSDIHGERRSVRARFSMTSEVPVLERLVLGAPERREPEARP